MHTALALTFFHLAPTPIAMCLAGAVVSLIALIAARTDLAHARPLDKIPALANLAYAAPMAVFGALHIWGIEFVRDIVPPYMPFRLFWAYFVGVALIAASLSIATRILVRWSGLLVALMMVLFVAILDIPGIIATPHDRIIWTITLRELAFASGALLFAATTFSGRYKSILVTAGRTVIAITAIFWGIQEFLHPYSRPVVPLEKAMPPFIPAQLLIGYLTAAFLIAAGALFLLNKRTRLAATLLGAWALLMVLVVYSPILYDALSTTDIFDTLYFAGAVLALAQATPHPK